MATLLKSIQTLIDNITVTDRQEENIKQSLSNIEGYLLNKENGLYIEKTFTNGSYERDTNIRPLDDIDMFAVLDFNSWKDENGNPPNPQSVLTKIRAYLNEQNDYEGKVKQDRPCVTIELSNKSFDILPAFSERTGGYLIPNYDLKSWTFTYPEKLTTELDEVHKKRNYRIKQTIKIIKYWNRENGKLIPSYHIEETAIAIFNRYDFANFEESVRLWFTNAAYILDNTKFKSQEDYTGAVNKVNKLKNKLNTALELYNNGKEGEAMQIWKDIFLKEFPVVDADEAATISKSLSEGALKISTAGTLSTAAGNKISASKGFYGSISEN